MMNQASDADILDRVAPWNRVALLMAGGDGTRLQELTKEISGSPIPKQYCRLLNNSSLLETTIERTRLFAPLNQINVVVNQNHLHLAIEQTHMLPRSNIFIQPQNRDTGPGFIFALLQLEQTNPDAIVAAFPTDHYIDNDQAFIEHVLRAVNAISLMPDKIAILGIAPDRPETGYGYILPSNPVGTSEGIYNVESFTEKPNFRSVRNILSSGGLWNTFVMVFKLSRMMELVRYLLPDEFERMMESRKSPDRAVELYKTLNSWNLSTQVLARIPQHLMVLEVVGVRWSDWGTRESIERTYRQMKIVPSWMPRPCHAEYEVA